MRKINLRSPFYFKVEKTGMTSVELNLYVYTGTFTDNASVSPSTLRYTITKEPLSTNDYVVFEIAELIRDYLEVEFDGGYDSQCVWVNAIPTVTAGTGDTTITPDNTDGFLGVEGYGYFEDGINPTLSGTLLQSNKVVHRVNDGVTRIPVWSENVDQVTYLLNGQTLESYPISSSTSTTGQITYIDISYNLADSFEERVLNNGGTFEDSDCLQSFLNSLDILEADEIYVESADDVEVLKIKTLGCSKFTPYKITFVNKFGALQDVWFSLKSTEQLTTKGETYKANTIDFDTLSYNTYNPQKAQFQKVGNESITLNTDYIDESYNDVIKELLMSEQVWITKIEDEELVLGVIPKTSSVQYKTVLNDNLINYTIQFDYAYDKINNVR